MLNIGHEGQPHETSPNHVFDGVIHYCTNLTNNSAHLVELHVREEARGKGIATKLIYHMLSKLPRQINTITLNVYKLNFTAIQTYENLGFNIVNSKIYKHTMQGDKATIEQNISELSKNQPKPSGSFFEITKVEYDEPKIKNGEYEESIEQYLNMVNEHNRYMVELTNNEDGSTSQYKDKDRDYFAKYETKVDKSCFKKQKTGGDTVCTNDKFLVFKLELDSNSNEPC